MMSRFRLSPRWIVLGVLAMALVVLPSPSALAARAARAERHFRIEATSGPAEPETDSRSPVTPVRETR